MRCCRLPAMRRARALRDELSAMHCGGSCLFWPAWAPTLMRALWTAHCNLPCTGTNPPFDVHALLKYSPLKCALRSTYRSICHLSTVSSRSLEVHGLLLSPALWPEGTGVPSFKLKRNVLVYRQLKMLPKINFLVYKQLKIIPKINVLVNRQLKIIPKINVLVYKQLKIFPKINFLVYIS